MRRDLWRTWRGTVCAAIHAWGGQHAVRSHGAPLKCFCEPSSAASLLSAQLSRTPWRLRRRTVAHWACATFWIGRSGRSRIRELLILRNEDLDRSARGGICSRHDGICLAGNSWSEGGLWWAVWAYRRVSAGALSGGWRRLRWAVSVSVHLFAQDLAQSASAPNDGDDEPVYPGTCRERKDVAGFMEPAGVNWRFAFQRRGD